MSEDDGEHVKEVYARFGLAVFHGQCLEHGIVNALVVLDLIPSRRHEARSQSEWGVTVDAFVDQHFETTMGRLLNRLRTVAQVPPELERLLGEALRKRNWLAHGFLRERAREFTSHTGREQMLAEVDACRSLFESADQRLEQIIRPLRNSQGITDELLELEYRRMWPGG